MKRRSSSAPRSSKPCARSAASMLEVTGTSESASTPSKSKTIVTGTHHLRSAAMVLAARLHAQLLSGSKPASPLEATRRLLAVQGQDPRGARLAIRARSTATTGAAVDRALNERELVITWVNRGTLHLIAAEDEPML